MHFLMFLPYYIHWHYGRGISDLFINLKNGFLFIPRFFSLSLLVRTLSEPWKRLNEAYHKGFDPGAFFSTIILNSLLRFVGFVIRGVTLLIGTLFLFLYTVCATIFFFLWIFFPVLFLFLLALSIKNIS